MSYKRKYKKKSKASTSSKKKTERTKTMFWRWTLNNPTDDGIKMISKYFDDGYAKYMVYQPEVAPNTGTPHLQGYTINTESRDLKFMKKYLSPRAALFMCDGRPEKNIAYCTKDDRGGEGSTPVHFGEYISTAPGKNGDQGQRSDLIAIEQMIRDKKTNREIAAIYPAQCLRMQGHITKYRAWIIAGDSKPSIQIHILYGPSGSGKTRTVYDKFPDREIYSHTDSKTGVWYDGYYGQKVIIFDEFYGQLPFNHLLKLTDRYKMHGHVKCSTVNLIPEHIYFTSNKAPDEWYSHLDATAFIRRITSIHKYKKLGKKPKKMNKHNYHWNNSDTYNKTKIDINDIISILVASPKISLHDAFKRLIQSDDAGIDALLNEDTLMDSEDDDLSTSSTAPLITFLD